MEIFALKVEPREIVRSFVIRLKPLWRQVSANGAVQGVSTGLGDDLHDAAIGFAVTALQIRPS